MAISVRQATPADIPILLSIVHGAFAEYRDRLDPPSGAHAETADTLIAAMETGFAAAASIDGQIVGCVFYSVKDRYVYAGRLSVLPEFRQSGAGRSLMQFAEEHAQDLGVHRIQIGVRTALPHLHAFYTKLGYLTVRLETHPGYTAPTSIVMEKELRRQPLTPS